MKSNEMKYKLSTYKSTFEGKNSKSWKECNMNIDQDTFANQK